MHSGETSNYLFMHQNSQHSFHDSTRQALAATKQPDGSIRMQTPQLNQQRQKVASLKEKWLNLNGNSSNIRCSSNMGNSSATATTSYALRDSGAAYNHMHQSNPYRPNSNISNLFDSRNNQMGRVQTYTSVDLAKFSQQSVMKDLSPIRASNLAPPHISAKRHPSGGSFHRMAENAQNLARTAAHDPRKRTNLIQKDGQSPIFMQHEVMVRNFEDQNSRNKSFKMNRHSHNGLNESGKVAQSSQSMRTSHSSPERMVNIICPPSKSPVSRKTKIQQNDKRPQSDQWRHQIYNSFTGNFETSKEKRKSLNRKMQSLAPSHWSGYLHSKSRLTANIKMLTPTKASKKSHRSFSKSKSKSKSRSHSRLGLHKSSVPHRSNSGLSAQKGLLTNHAKKNNHVNKLVKDGSKNRLRRKSKSKNSLRSRSRSRSASVLSSNSNINRSEAKKNCDDLRQQKYTKNQNKTSTIKKSFNFASIDTQGSHKLEVQEPAAFAPNMVSGQTTGKFRSVNEPMITKTMPGKYLQQKSTVMFKDCNVNLKTEDDYGETLTASSEDSPYRGPSERVKRAAQLTTKNYIEFVNNRVENLVQQENSVREFGPRKMKAAQRGINERQGARLQFLKQQMKESLIETHHLQAKLQNSHPNDQAKNRGGLSQFNSLVLDFSQNLENMATSLIEATENKRKNLRMKSMIAEMQETRRQRSMSKSAPNSARRSRNSLKNSRHNSASKRSSVSKRSSNSKAESSRSKSSRKSSSHKFKKGKKLSRKRSQSGKKLKKRSKTKSVKSLRRSASFKSAKKLQRSASVASQRSRSRSSKKIASVKRNIFKQTNGFRNTESTALILKPKRSVSRNKSQSRPKSKSASRKRSHSQTLKTRVNEVAQKCKKLINHKFEVTKGIKTAMSRLRMRSTSKGKVNLSKPRKNRSKSRKKLTRKGTKSKSKSKSKVRKNSKSPSNRGSKGNAQATPKPSLCTPNLTPMMTPLHKILRNSMGDRDISDIMRTGRKVQICSRRLQDITQLASSDSDSSYDSEDSLDYERQLRQQQAHLSPWQRACVRKQFPKKLR